MNPIDKDLFEAAKNGNLKKVKFLIKNGANVNAKDKNGGTALMLAAEHWHFDIIDILVDNGADVQILIDLFDAIQNGNLKKVKLLIDNGANVNMRQGDGWTPLMLAINRGHLDIIKLLIESGADVNAKNCIGLTPLMFASIDGQLDVAKILVENGANVTTKNGAKALRHADIHRHRDIIKFLIENGADANTLIDMPTPECKGHIKCIRMLAQRIVHTIYRKITKILKPHGEKE